jgi:hypothetical protein
MIQPGLPHVGDGFCVGVTHIAATNLRAERRLGRDDFHDADARTGEGLAVAAGKYAWWIAPGRTG